MWNLMKRLSTVIVLTLCPALFAIGEDHHHNPNHAQQPSLDEQLHAPGLHTHFSSNGTPYVHHFNLEPAFNGRDLILSYHHIDAGDEKEFEVEAELEWAFTKRFGVIIEAPLVQVNADTEPTHTGLGDIAIVPRVVLIEKPDFILSGLLEVVFPSGDDKRDLGGGEYKIGPALATWMDLGNWVTLSTHFGSEHGLESDVVEVFYRVGLAYSFTLNHEILHVNQHEGHAAHGAHFSKGMTSLLLEYTGVTALSGPDEEESIHELLIGVAHSLSESMDVRFGYQFSPGKPREIDKSFVAGFIFHF